MASEAVPVSTPGSNARSDENTLDMYYALNESMVEAFKGDSEGREQAEGRKQAEDIAHSLIVHVNLPLLIRCRALCILGCSNEGDFVRYAEEAVHFGEVAVQQETEAGDDGDLSTANLILESSQDVLKEAKAAATVIESEEDSDEDVDEDEEVVWDPDWSEERQAAASAAWSARTAQAVARKAEEETAQAVAGKAKEQSQQAGENKNKKKKKKKNVRRVDSANPNQDTQQYEELDLATGRWVPLGTAQSVEWVDADDEEMLLVD